MTSPNYPSRRELLAILEDAMLVTAFLVNLTVGVRVLRPLLEGPPSGGPPMSGAAAQAPTHLTRHTVARP